MAKKSYNVTLSPVTVERISRIAEHVGISFSSSIDLAVCSYADQMDNAQRSTVERLESELDDVIDYLVKEHDYIPF